ncbi:MAG TPA: phage tail tube protein [Geothrix sp.]|nr:phage tail tube protein [Geothrix sp.]
MPGETGNQTRLSYIKEVTFGTTPATPTGTILRWTNLDLGPDRDYLENPEMRTDRQYVPGRGGVILGKGSFGGPLSYGTYDDFLASALGTDWATNVSKVGTTRLSFTMEKGHLVNGIYFPYTGVVVNGFELSGKANQNVEAKFDLISKAAGNEAAATIWSGTTAANTNPLITSWDGTVKKGGSTMGTVVGWSLKGDNSYEDAYVCGQSSLYDLQPGRLKLTGSLELYFDSSALYTDFRAENEFALQLNLGPGGTKSYTIDLGRCRITKWVSNPNDENLMTQTVEIECYAPTAGTDTAMKLTRLP